MSNSDNNEKIPFSVRWQIFCARMKLKWFEFKVWYQNKFNLSDDESQGNEDPAKTRSKLLIDDKGKISNKIREIKNRWTQMRELLPVYFMLFRAKTELNWYKTRTFFSEEIPEKARRSYRFFKKPEESWQFYKIVLAFIIDVIVLCHICVGAVLGWILRLIGFVLGFIPWGIRLAAVMIVAALITAWISQFGVAYFMMKNPASAEREVRRFNAQWVRAFTSDPVQAEEKVRRILKRSDSDYNIIQGFQDSNDNRIDVDSDANGTDFHFVLHTLSDEQEEKLKEVKAIFEKEVAAHEEKRQEDIAQLGYASDERRLKENNRYSIPLEKAAVSWNRAINDPLAGSKIPVAKPLAGVGLRVDPITGMVIPMPDKRETILSNVADICGVSYVYLQDAESVVLQDTPDRIVMNIEYERDGRVELTVNYTLRFNNPTPRQRELANQLSSQNEFNKTKFMLLEEMLNAGYEVDGQENVIINPEFVRKVIGNFERRTILLHVNNAAPMQKSLLYVVEAQFEANKTKTLPYSVSYRESLDSLHEIRKQIARNKVYSKNVAEKTQLLKKFLEEAHEEMKAGEKRQTKIFEELLFKIEEMEKTHAEREAAAVDAADELSVREDYYLKISGLSTSFFNPYQQYSLFNSSSLSGIVDGEIYKMNLVLIMKRYDEVRRAEKNLLDQAEIEIEQWRVSNNRRKGTIPGNIREQFVKNNLANLENHLPEPEKLITRESLEQMKQSDPARAGQVREWLSNYYKSIKLNEDNLRYDIEHLEIMYDEGMVSGLESYTAWPAEILTWLLILAAILLFAATFLAITRKYIYYFALFSGAAFAIYWFCLLIVACDVPDQLMNFVPQNQQPTIDNATRNAIWLDYFWGWSPVAIFSLFLWLPLLGASARKYFKVGGGKTDSCAAFAKNLACRGESRRFYKSLYWVTFYYLFFMIILPFLVQSCEELVAEDEYLVPKGDGGGQVQVQPMKVIKKKKKPKEKEYILNPYSGYMFNAVQIPDEEHLEELDEMTESQYETTGGGTFGPGKKGGKPGWPNGMEGAKVRFIRLKYNGGDWEQDMGKGSDYNMLLKIKEWTGFDIADDTEFITASDLKVRFRKKGRKPPFIYITGGLRGGINLTQAEVKILRDYILNDGGMIFADNGGGNFDGQFRNMMRRILPNHNFVDIANDDMIYQAPFVFPSGAPRLFHHSGDRALGIKNNGRWVVFYHQGDINDAWKAGGSGISKQQQEMAFRLGANVICYAFSAYLAEVYEDANK